MTITIALTKGRIEKSMVDLLTQAGFDMSFMQDKGRHLIFESPDQAFRFLLVKAPDVATYVRHGVADLGIVDIVETGSTLVANGLVEFEDICRISARMITNQAAIKNKPEVMAFIKKIESIVGRKEQAF